MYLIFVFLWLHSFSGKWEGWDPFNRFNHTSWMDVVTPTYRRLFCGVFVLSRCFCLLFCGCRGLCHTAESDLFFSNRSFFVFNNVLCINRLFCRNVIFPFLRSYSFLGDVSMGDVAMALSK